eukprot:358517-Chlamydomonas_euryale.AAC.4
MRADEHLVGMDDPVKRHAGSELAYHKKSVQVRAVWRRLGCVDRGGWQVVWTVKWRTSRGLAYCKELLQVLRCVAVCGMCVDGCGCGWVSRKTHSHPADEGKPGQSKAIERNQRQSRANEGDQGQSKASNGNEGQTRANEGNQGLHHRSARLTCNCWPSAALATKGNQSQYRAMQGMERQSTPLPPPNTHECPVNCPLGAQLLAECCICN